MRLLLDTHVYLWWLNGDPKLRRQAGSAIAAPSSIVHVSAVSIWEIAIKVRLGRLGIEVERAEQEIPLNHFTELPVTCRHARLAGALPLHHSDPFDRMLIAQAQAERLTLMTRDPDITRYDLDWLQA